MHILWCSLLFWNSSDTSGHEHWTSGCPSVWHIWSVVCGVETVDQLCFGASRLHSSFMPWRVIIIFFLLFFFLSWHFSQFSVVSVGFQKYLLFSFYCFKMFSLLVSVLVLVVLIITVWKAYVRKNLLKAVSPNSTASSGKLKCSFFCFVFKLD